jgi:hypothetical protein
VRSDDEVTHWHDGMVMLGEKGHDQEGRKDDGESYGCPPGLVTEFDGPIQKPVSELAVRIEVSVLAEVGEPGDGDCASFGILPALAVHGYQLLVRLGGEVR